MPVVYLRSSMASRRSDTQVEHRPPENETIRRLAWSGLVAGLGALASILAHRLSAAIWRRAFNEEPPE